jgi:hypothetical protein
MRSAREIVETGRFESFNGTVPNAEFNRFFSEDMKKR